MDKSDSSLIPTNFCISDDHLCEGGAKAEFHRNMETIHLLHRLEAEHGIATPQSRACSRGSLADILGQAKAAWAREYRKLSAALTGY